MSRKKNQKQSKPATVESQSTSQEVVDEVVTGAEGEQDASVQDDSEVSSEDAGVDSPSDDSSAAESDHVSAESDDGVEPLTDEEIDNWEHSQDEAQADYEQLMKDLKTANPSMGVTKSHLCQKFADKWDVNFQGFDLKSKEPVFSPKHK